MTITLSIHPNRCLAYFRFHDVVDANQGAQAFVDYVTAKSFSPDFTMLSDTSHLDSVNADYRSMLTGVLSLRKPLRKFKKPVVSIVYAPSDFYFGMARILEQILNPVSNIRMIVTRSETEALRLAQQPEKTMKALRDAVTVADVEPTRWALPRKHPSRV